MFRRNLGLVRLGMPRTKGFWLGLFVASLQAISAVALLATSAWLISRAAEMPPVLYLQLAVVGVRGFALGRAFFRYVERILLHDAAFKQLAETRPRVFAALIPFAPAGFGKLRAGELLSRITSDVDELQFLPLRVLSPLVQSAIVAVLSVVGLSLLVPEAALTLAIACFLAFFVALPVSGWSARRADAQIADDRAALSSETLKLFESLDEFRSFGWAGAQLSEISKAEAKLAVAARATAWSQGTGQALFALLSIGATTASAYFAATAFDAGQIAGVWVAVVALLPLAVFDVLQTVQPVASAWRRYLVSASRVQEVLGAELPRYLPEVSTSPSHSATETEIKPFESLELIGASIAYDTEAVVKNLNLKVSAGEVVALSGRSGAGKSSVGLVLAGFLSLQSGSYLYNAVDASELATSTLRTKVAYLQQHPTIFDGDVIANLRVASPEATEAEMIAVLERVGLWQMLESREGLQTHLGELGRALSGGESARLALARALLFDFDVLVFDEPTANLDYETANALMTDLLAMAKSRSNRAVILISHDVDLVARADKVVQL